MAEEETNKKEKKIQKKWEKYSLEGDTATRKNRSCPKCGSGVFLAEHKDRFSCGSCGYMEKKTAQPPAETSE